MKVRLYCHAGQMTGYGRAAEGLAHSMLAAGIDLEIRPLADYATLRFAPEHAPLAALVRRDHELSPNPDAIIVHTLPGSCGKALDAITSQMHTHQADGCSFIAYTTWEAVSPLPRDIADSLLMFDQVWVPSKATWNTMAPSSVSAADQVMRVKVIPHAFNETSLEERRAQGIQSDKFRFYYLGAWNNRKNPAGLIAAYARAFTRGDDVRLAICSTGARQEDFFAALSATGLVDVGMDIGLMPFVQLQNQPMPDERVIGLHQSMDCFVTASRGEAWNLPAFEAVLAGRHVISPGDLGSDEFLIDTSYHRINNAPAPAAVDVQFQASPEGAVSFRVAGAQGLTCRADWLEPDLSQLAKAMRRAYEMRNRNLTTHYDLAARFSYRAVGKLVRQALEDL